MTLQEKYEQQLRYNEDLRIRLQEAKQELDKLDKIRDIVFDYLAYGTDGTVYDMINKLEELLEEKNGLENI